MANPYTDPKYQLARMMREQRTSVPSSSYQLPGGAPSKTAVQLGRAASNMAITNPSLAERLNSIASSGKAAEPKGLVGSILGNPIAKTALNGLNLLAVPGRATVAGIREVVDAVDNDPATRASLGEFKKNVSDPSFGFGKAFKINTGNIWLDRGIGLVGDIALDPLTYATFGAGKFAGYTGRLDLAKAVLSTTGDEALANAVQRFGRAAIKDADVLQRVGANRHGIYMFGKRVKIGKMGQGIRIPGTGAIGALGDNVLAKMRVGVMGTKTGRYIQRLSMPAEGLLARQALAQGDLSNRAAATTISFLTAEPIARTVAGETLQREEQALYILLNREKTMGLDAYKDTLHLQIEDPVAFAAASPDEQRAATVFRDLFKGKEDDVAARYVEIDPTAQPGFVENYFPRMQSDDAISYRMDPSNPHSASLNNMFDRDPLEGGRNFKARTMKPGDDWFGHTLTVEDLKSTDRLNKLANEGGFVGNFFETDINKVTAKYIQEYSKEIGLLARHKHLVDTGYWKRLESIEVTGEVIDKHLVDTFKSQIKSLDSELSAARKGMSDNLDSMSKALDTVRTNMNKRLVEETQKLQGMRTLGGELKAVDSLLNGSEIDDILRNNVVGMTDNVSVAANRIGTVAKSLAEMFDGKIVGGKFVPNSVGASVSDIPLVADGLISHLALLENDMLKIAEDRADAVLNLTGKELQDAEKAARDAMQAAMQRLESAQAHMQDAVAFGNMVEASLRYGIASATVGDMTTEVVNMMTVLNNTGKIGSKEFTSLVTEKMNIKGSLQDYIIGRIKNKGDIFHQLTEHARIKHGDVTTMNLEDFFAGLSTAFGGGSKIDDVRALGIWALMFDDRLYGGKIPEALIPVRTQLLEELRRADTARAFDAATRGALQRGARRSSQSIFEGEFDNAYNQAIQHVTRIEQLQQAIDELGPLFEDNPSAFITREVFDQLKVKYPALDDIIVDEFEISNSEIMNLMDNYNVLEDFDGASIGFNVDGPRDIRPEGLGRNFQFAPDINVTGGYQIELHSITPTELVDRMKSKISESNIILDNAGFRIGSGSSEKMYSGREILAKYDEYQKVVDEYSFGRKALRSATEERKYANGYFKLQAEMDQALSKAGSAAEESAIRTRFEPRLKALEEQARQAAFSEDFRPNLVDALRKRGYYDIPIDDPGFARARKDIRSAVLRDFAEQGYFQPTGVVRNRSGRVIGEQRPARYVLGEFISDARNRRAAIAGSGLDKPEWFNGVDMQSKKLLDTLMTYTALSQVHMRFNVAQTIAGSHGGAMTPGAFAPIVEGVKQMLFPKIDSRINALSRATSILTDLDGRVSVAISERAADENVAQILYDAINALPTRDRDILTEALGPEINWTVSPTDLHKRWQEARRGKSTQSVGFLMNEDGTFKLNKNGQKIKAPTEATMAENVFFDTHVRPWFETAFPGEVYSKDTAKSYIRKYSSGTGKRSRDAFSYNATPTDVKRWFERHLGNSSVYGRSASQKMRTEFANQGGGLREAWNVIGKPEGVIASKLREAKKIRTRIDGLLGYDVDVAQMFSMPGKAQRTSTLYENLLKGHADDLEAQIAEKVGANADIVAKRAELTTAQGALSASEAEVQRLQNVKPIVDAIDERATEIQKLIAELEPDASRSIAIRKQIKDLRSELGNLQERRAQAVALPESVKGTIASAEAKSAKRAATGVEFSNVEEEIKSLEKERRVLKNKQRTVKGLTKKEQSRLNAVDKRLPKAREEFKAGTSKAPGMTEAERSVYAIPAARRKDALGMYETLDEYNKMIASPAYAKSDADREMANAIMMLSGFDLSFFNKGFTVDGKQFVKMADGSHVVFSKAEWDSLFAHVGDNSAQIREINQLITNAIEENKRLSRMRGIDLTGAMADFKAGSASFADLYGRTDNVFNSIDVRIKSNTDLINDLIVREQSLYSETQNMALEKMRLLMTQEFEVTFSDGSTRTVKLFDQDGLNRFAANHHPTIRLHGRDGITVGYTIPDVSARQRKSMFQWSWMNTPEYDYIRRVEALQNSLHVRAFQDAVNDVAKKRSVVEQINSQLAKKIEESSGLSAGIQRTRESIVDVADNASQQFETTFGRPLGELAPATEVTGSNVLGERVANLTPAERIAAGESADVLGQGIQPTPESARAFADTLGEQARQERFGQPVIQRVNGESAVDTTAQEYVSARQQITVSRNAEGKKVVYGKVVDDYNAAKESADAWNKRHPQIVADFDKQWTLKHGEFESAQKVVAALRQGRSDIITEMRVKYGTVEDFWREVYNQNNLIKSLQSNYDDIDTLIKTLPPKDAVGILRKSARKGASVPEAEVNRVLTNYRDWVRDSKPVIERLVNNPEDPVYRAFAAAAQADYDLIWLDYAKRDAMEKLVLAETDTWRTVVVEPFAKGWEDAAKASGIWDGSMKRMGSRRDNGTTVGFPGLAGNKEALDILDAVSRFRKPGTVSDLSRFMRGYTGFFKSYATLSPGFHVRNGISNVFSLFAANADIPNMFEGFKYWRIMEDTFAKGGTLDDFVAKLPTHLQERGRGSASIMLGLGGGKIDNAMEGFFREGSRLTDNAAIRSSRSAGHKVEGSARFMLAWDSIAKGMDTTLAFNRTKRFLIDYQSKTILDEYMKDIVPFWTWMSRNLPLQVMNRWANPKPYLMYDKFRKNFNQETGPGEVVPQWLQETGGINLGGGTFLNPDLPFTRVDQQISEMSNPQKMLSYVNPGIRAPLEFMMNRNTYTGKEFPNTYQPVSGVNMALLPLLQALGQTETNNAGQPVATAKSMATLQSMLPMLGRTERLFPTTEAGQGKVSNAWMSFMGLPVTSVSQQAQNAEMNRRMAMLQAELTKQKNIQGAK